jgi:hypothetical protein
VSHYSTFDLDVAFAEGLASHPEIEAHLEECKECAAYIAELRAYDVPQLRKKKNPWLAPAVATLALAAALFLFLRHPPTSRGDGEGGYVGVKGGAPASMLLLKRAEITRPWDGREPIRPGDVIAVHVACEGRPTVRVLAKDDGQWVEVAAKECPREPGVLPFTLVVDERPGDEEIRVVFEKEEPIDFALPKEVSR